MIAYEMELAGPVTGLKQRVYYPGEVSKDKDSDYGCSFRDFPGCVAASVGLVNLYCLAVEALQFHIDGMVEDGDDLPDGLYEPSGSNSGQTLWIPVFVPVLKGKR